MDVRTYQISTKNSGGSSSSNSGGNNSYAPISHKHEASDIKESLDRVFLSKKERDSLLEHLKSGCGHNSDNNNSNNTNNDIGNENRTYIYREGFESINFCGEIIVSGYNREGGSVYKHADYIDINCKGSTTCTRSITHNEAIDLTNFNKIKIDYLLNDGLQPSNKNAGLRLAQRNDAFSDHSMFNSYYIKTLSLLNSKGRVEVELDISEVSGPHYIHVGMDQWSRTSGEFRIFIKNIWLE